MSPLVGGYTTALWYNQASPYDLDVIGCSRKPKHEVNMKCIWYSTHIHSGCTQARIFFGSASHVVHILNFCLQTGIACINSIVLSEIESSNTFTCCMSFLASVHLPTESLFLSTFIVDSNYSKENLIVNSRTNLTGLVSVWNMVLVHQCLYILCNFRSSNLILSIFWYFICLRK